MKEGRGHRLHSLCSSGAIRCACDVLPQLMAIRLAERSFYEEAGVCLLSWLCVLRESIQSVDCLRFCLIVYLSYVCAGSIFFLYFDLNCGGIPLSASLHSVGYHTVNPCLRWCCLCVSLIELSGSLQGVLFPQPPFQSPKEGRKKVDEERQMQTMTSVFLKWSFSINTRVHVLISSTPQLYEWGVNSFWA